MNALDFLSQAYRADQQIQSKVQQIDRLRATAGDIRLVYEQGKVQSSSVTSRVEEAVMRIIEEEENINAEIDHLVDVKLQIRAVINRVEDVTLRLILEKRYLLFEQWSEIGNDLFMSPRWAQEKHKDALLAVQEILDRIVTDIDMTDPLH